MKSWQVLVGVFGLVALVCCGGGGFLAYRAYNGYQATGADSTAYADKELPLILKDWNVNELEAQQSPELANGSPLDIKKKWFEIFKDKLGSFKSSEPSRMTSESVYQGTNGAYTRAVVHARAVFENNYGDVSMMLYKRNGKWSIGVFWINSPALASLDAASTKPSGAQ